MEEYISTIESLNKDIALLKAELERVETMNNVFENQVLLHLSDISPDQIKRVLNDSHIPNHYSSGSEDLNTQEQLNKEILGYDLKSARCVYQEENGKLLKVYEVNGNLKAHSFSIEFAVQVDERKGKEVLQEIKSLEVTPQTDILNAFAAHIKKEIDLLPCFISCLCVLESLQEARAKTAEQLNEYMEVELREERDVLYIDVAYENYVITVKWEILFKDKHATFLNIITSQFSDEQVLELCKNAKCLKILKQEECLSDGDGVVSFVTDLFGT